MAKDVPAGKLGGKDPIDVTWDETSSGSFNSKDAQFEGNDADIDTLLMRNNAEVRQYPDWTPGKGEPTLHYLKRLGTEGHTFIDAWLLAAGCIGQVMMTTPNAWHKMGLVPGAILIVWGTIIGFWTIWQLKAMYYDRKRDLINRGTWFDDPDKPYMRKHKTQLQELLGYYLGKGKGPVRFVAFLISFYWFGVCVAQILASATNYYAIDKTHNLRTLIIIFGATLLPFGYIPNFRKMRVILIIGVAGTMLTGVFGIFTAFQHGFKDYKEAPAWPRPAVSGPVFAPFFNGVAILFSILDHHNIFAETIEAMQHPRKYSISYFFGFFPLFFMIVPPGILLNLAFGAKMATAENWFILAPNSAFKTLSVFMMILHNVQAWVLWITPFSYIWEKLWGVHHKPFWVRSLVRTPLLLSILLFATAFPFYGAINTLMTGLTSPLLMYVVPCLAFLLHYRNQSHREHTVYPLAKTLYAMVGWGPIAAVNIGLVIYGIVLVGFTCSMAIYNLYSKSSTFGFFPACYGCVKPK